MTDHLQGVYSSEDPNWRTPRPLFARLHDEFNFTFDLAADAENHLVPKWFGPGSHYLEDALSVAHWSHIRGFLNPPYSRKRKMPIQPWLQRCLHTQHVGGLVVGIVPSRTDTPWWHDYVLEAREIRHVRGRIHFEPSPEWVAANPGKRSSGNFPASVVIWDGRGSRSRRAPHVCSLDWK